MSEEGKRIFADMAAAPNADKLAPRGVREIGTMVADFLQSVVADAETNVDRGFGFGEFDCYVKMDGTEYAVTVKRPMRRNV